MVAFFGHRISEATLTLPEGAAVMALIEACGIMLETSELEQCNSALEGAVCAE